MGVLTPSLADIDLVARDVLSLRALPPLTAVPGGKQGRGASSVCGLSGST